MLTRFVIEKEALTSVRAEAFRTLTVLFRVCLQREGSGFEARLGAHAFFSQPKDADDGLTQRRRPASRGVTGSPGSRRNFKLQPSHESFQTSEIRSDQRELARRCRAAHQQRKTKTAFLFVLRLLAAFQDAYD